MNPGLSDSMSDAMLPFVNDWGAYCEWLADIVHICWASFQRIKINYREKSVVDMLMYCPDPLAVQVWEVPSADSHQLSATSWPI